MAEQVDTLISLVRSLDMSREAISRYDAYYEGEQPIRFIAPLLAEEFGERITSLVLNFPRLIADAYTERLTVEGFRYSGDSSADGDLWAIWQANDLDEISDMAHSDAIALSRAYAIVGSPDAADDAPIITIESPMQVFARRDARTRRVISAVKRWDERPNGESPSPWTTGGPVEQHAVLYLPDSTTHYVNAGGGGWVVTGSTDVHNLGRVPVVPLVNNPRTLRPDGRSEFHDAIGPADAANKMATDMMVSGEYHAMPRRWAAGIKKSDFEDEQGRALSPWSRDAGTLWATEAKDASFGQFTESDLRNFHETIKLLATILVELSGLPPHLAPLAGTNDNPTSADAMRAAESRFVRRTERKQTAFGGGWEDVQRLAVRFMTGDWDPRAMSLETVWRDASTPTLSQKADATLKLATPVQNGRAIVPLEQARIDLGYTQEQRDRMAEMDRVAAQDPYLATLAQKDAAGGAASPAAVG